MISPKVFFSRLNENRNKDRISDWMTEEQLLKATGEFFLENGYSKIEYGKNFARSNGGSISLPIVGSKVPQGEQLLTGVDSDTETETIGAFFRPRIDQYDLNFFGTLEDILFELVDNYADTPVMLVTDSLSYFPVTKVEEIAVEMKNLMDEGMYLLFVNNRHAYALFDEFAKLSKPIPAPDLTG
jgi:hypothetical protein